MRFERLGSLPNNEQSNTELWQELDNPMAHYRNVPFTSAHSGISTTARQPSDIRKPSVHL